MIKGFIQQLMFFTRIPVPFNIEYDEEAFTRGIILSPVVGLLIGLLLCGFYFIFIKTDVLLLTIIFVIVFEIFITGGLHLDGLADTFDGIFSNRSKEEILEIMKDPRIGTNGTLALVITIITKGCILISINQSNIYGYLLIMPAVSRMNIHWSCANSDYAREKGLGGPFINNSGLREVALTTIITAVTGSLILKNAAIPAIIIPVGFTLAFTFYVKKRIGGITGDTLGAVIELSEIVFLMTLLFWEKIFLYGQ